MKAYGQPGSLRVAALLLPPESDQLSGQVGRQESRVPRLSYLGRNKR